MNVEDRLRDLRQATRGQLRPSPQLLARIEGSIHRPAPRDWSMALASAMAVVALVVALALGQGDDGQQVATRPPSREEFVAAADQRCLAFAEQRDKVQVVFPTPEAYALAADNIVGVLTRSIDDTQTIGAPTDAHDLLETTLAELRHALDQAQRAKELASAGDTAGAAGALDEVGAIQLEVGNALADYGATQCRPRPS